MDFAPIVQGFKVVRWGPTGTHAPAGGSPSSPTRTVAHHDPSATWCLATQHAESDQCQGRRSQLNTKRTPRVRLARFLRWRSMPGASSQRTAAPPIEASGPRYGATLELCSLHRSPTLLTSAHTRQAAFPLSLYEPECHGLALRYGKTDKTVQ